MTVSPRGDMTPTPKPDHPRAADDRRIAAYHEAAHAVAGARVGTVEYLAWGQPGRGPATTNVIVSVDDPLGTAVYCLAGEVANLVCILGGPENDADYHSYLLGCLDKCMLGAPKSGDFVAAEEYLEKLGGGPGAWKRAAEQTVRFVIESWPAITVIAEEFLTVERLEGTRLDELVAASLAANPPTIP